MQNADRGVKSAEGRARKAECGVWNSRFPTAQSSHRGFTLIEILVTVGLLSFIILGLLAMFNQTQRAFTSSMTQTDVLEAGRITTDMMVRELEQMIPSEMPDYVNGGSVYHGTNFYAEVSTSFIPPLLQGLPGTTMGGVQACRTNIVQNFFFLSRQNQDLIGTGYAVVPAPLDAGVGTLYRFSLQIAKINQMWRLVFGNSLQATNPMLLPSIFENALLLAQQNSQLGLPVTNLNRIADGVVHLRLQAFDTNGMPILPARPGFGQQPAVLRNTTWYWDQNLTAAGYGYEQSDCYFWSNAVPAYVELELGILEPQVLQRYRTFESIGNAALRRQSELNYLSNHVAQVHIFRQRIPIRNVDATAYQ